VTGSAPFGRPGLGIQPGDPTGDVVAGELAGAGVGQPDGTGAGVAGADGDGKPDAAGDPTDGGAEAEATADAAGEPPALGEAEAPGEPEAPADAPADDGGVAGVQPGPRPDAHAADPTVKTAASTPTVRRP
jgi:hypothetical protein